MASLHDYVPPYAIQLVYPQEAQPSHQHRSTIEALASFAPPPSIQPSPVAAVSNYSHFHPQRRPDAQQRGWWEELWRRRQQQYQRRSAIGPAADNDDDEDDDAGLMGSADDDGGDDDALMDDEHAAIGSTTGLVSSSIVGDARTCYRCR